MNAANKNSKSGKGRSKNWKNRKNNYDSANRAQREDVSTSGPRQDFAWYNNFPELTQTVGTLFYTQPSGYVVDDPLNFSGDYSVPGGMILKSVYGPGVCTDMTSAGNVAITKLFVSVRKTNMGGVPYEPADFGLYLLANMSCHVSIATLMRLYGLITKYDATNLYWPRYVMKEMGFDYDSFVSNRPKLRDLILTLQNMINTRAIPMDYDILKRHITMYSNIFGDSTNTKGQLYIHNPAGHYIYDPFTDKKGGRLLFYKYATAGTDEYPNGYTFEDFSQLIMNQFNAFLNDQDMAIISGDIIRAFGEGSVMTWPPMPADWEVEVKYGTDWLSQIENATIPQPAWYEIATANAIEGTSEDSGLNITQAEGYIVYRPRASSNNDDEEVLNIIGNPHQEWINNQHMLAPDVAAVCESTRLTALFAEYSDESGSGIEVYTCGSELVVSAITFNMSKNSNGVFVTDSSWCSCVEMSAIGVSEIADIELARSIPSVTNCDWAPIGATFNRSSAFPSGYFVGFIGDLDNWVAISKDYLKRIHRACLWSEFANKLAGNKYLK